MIIGSIITGFIFAQQATMFAELYEPQVRYSAVSIGFQVATVIGGGFGPLIAQALQQGAGGSTVPVSAYLVLVAVIGLISTHAITRRARSNS
jgi:MHS family shikimate/dehydroshikimate transporter-like MFS transporter